MYIIPKFDRSVSTKILIRLNCIIKVGALYLLVKSLFMYF